MIDLDMGTISFMRNGASLGQAFSHIRRLEYYPAASLSYGEPITLPWQAHRTCRRSSICCVQHARSTCRQCLSIYRIKLQRVWRWAATEGWHCTQGNSATSTLAVGRLPIQWRGTQPSSALLQMPGRPPGYWAPLSASSHLQSRAAGG